MVQKKQQFSVTKIAVQRYSSSAPEPTSILSYPAASQTDEIQCGVLRVESEVMTSV